MAKLRVIPGFKLTLIATLLFVLIMVLIPLTGLALKSATLSIDQVRQILTSPRVWAACRLSVVTALAAAAVNAVMGTLVAWVLVRCPFKGRGLADALVDLPVALPTAVAGLALATLYSPKGFIGHYLGSLGFQVAFTPVGIFIAMVFVGVPFLVRSVQPVLQNLPQDYEEVAMTLGARGWQHFAYVVLPQLLPAIFTGAALAFARAIGEYGSVIFIAGNVPMVSEIAPLMIIGKLEQYDYAGATVIALLLLLLSLGVLTGIYLVQARFQQQEAAL